MHGADLLGDLGVGSETESTGVAFRPEGPCRTLPSEDGGSMPAIAHAFNIGPARRRLDSSFRGDQASGSPTRLSSAVGLLGEQRVVRRADDGGAVLLGARRSRLATSSAFASSSRAVGSSARTMRGAPASARATATRWRSPAERRADEAQPVAEADRLERGRGALGRLVGRELLQRQRELDVLDRGQERDEPICWPTTREVLAPERRALGAVELAER